MTFPRKIGLLLILAAALATFGHFAHLLRCLDHGLLLPSLSWFYSFELEAEPVTLPRGGELEWATIIGLAWCALMAVAGLVMIIRGGGFQWNPLTLRKMERFRSIGRGHASFRILMVLLAVALLDQVVVGQRALAVKYEGRWCFPAFQNRVFTETDFGGDSEERVDFRALAERFENTEHRVILPPVPWDATEDSDDMLERPLPLIDGRIHGPDGQPYRGYAYAYAADDRERLVRSGRVRDGRLQGSVEVYGPGGERIGREIWEAGELVESKVPGEADLPEAGRWVRRFYAPLPPSLKHGHYLGTDSNGWDIVAQLHGGLQVIFQAAAFYLVATYGIGIVMGCLMGYFGGTYDLIMQRIMEIMSNVPFLLVVMIVRQGIGGDDVGLAAILAVFCVFSWIQVAIYMRTSTFKEKARDYASAARVLGAGTGRVIFRHILPNAISIIVTLVPFSVAVIVMQLTALDFLGFGVPDSVPSWGRILEDGRRNLGSPWIVSSGFGVMVFLLLLITFVGEAVREAFDPKKFTVYQ